VRTIRSGAIYGCLTPLKAGLNHVRGRAGP